MTVLVVCNQGAFSDSVIATLGTLSLHSKSLVVDKSKPLQLLCEEFQAFFSLYHFDAVLFVSGETRIEEYMDKLNFRFPAIIALICSVRQIPLLYLSSISIFGFPRSRRYSAKYFPTTPPVDLYGKSKFMLDSYILNTLPSFPCTSILPGSFVKFPLNRCTLAKLYRFIQIPLVLKITSFVCPSGTLLVVKSDDLVKLICIELHLLLQYSSSVVPHVGTKKRVLASTPFPVSNVVKDITGRSPLFMLPSCGFFLFKHLYKAFPLAVFKKLCFIFVQFVSD